MPLPVTVGGKVAAADINAIANLPVASFASLPATGNWLGRQIAATDTGISWRWDGAAWRAWGSSWITYTPTVVGFTIGTGGAAASVFRYRYAQGVVRVKFRRTLGTTGFAVASNPTFSLPVSSVAVPHQLAAHAGFGSAFDVSAVNVAGLLCVASDSLATDFRIYTIGATYAAGAINATLPWTWAAGDAVAGEFVYEPA